MSKLSKKILEAARGMVGDNAFVNMAANLGTMRDKASYGQYKALPAKTVAELNIIYGADWIAKRIINKPAYDATRAGFYFENIELDDSLKVGRYAKDIKLNKHLLKAVACARLHGWSYILIGARDRLSLDQPLQINEGQPLGFITVLKRHQCEPKKEAGFLSADLTGGLWEEPEYYLMGKSVKKTTVHHSRIIKIEAPDPIGDENGNPTPILQQVYETLRRQTSVAANAESLVYESKIDIIRTPKLIERLLTGGVGTMNGIVAHYAAMGRMKGNNGMMVLDKDEEFDSKSYNFSGLSDLMREFSVQTAGAADMPYSLLFGQSPAGMNATGDYDINSYYDNILTMQEHTLREPLEMLIGHILDSMGVAYENMGLIFNTLHQTDKKVLAEIEKSNADKDKLYWDMGVLNEEQIARQLKENGTYTVISDDHLLLLKNLSSDIEVK